jgi:O-antigen ligase
MPMAGFSTAVGGYPISPAKAATALLLVLAVLQFALTSQRKLPRDRAKIALAVFGVSLVISSIVSVVQGMSVPIVTIAAFRFVGLIAFYFLLLYVVRTRDDLVLIFWALVIGGTITAFPGLIEVQEGTYLSAGQRSAGLAGKSNTLGYELGICMPLAFGLYFAARSTLRKLFLLGAVALMMVAIVGSLSRSTFVAIAAMWAFWIWRSRRIDTLKYAFPAVAIAVALVFVMPTKVYERIETMTDPTLRDEDRSMNSRVGQAIWAGKAVLTSPVVGIGVNNYIPWVQNQPGGAMYHNNMHSGFLYILATQGLLGFIPFMALVLMAWFDYSAAQRLVRSRRSRGDPALRELGSFALFLQIALLGAMIGALVHPMADSKGWWLLFGLSTVTVSLVRQRIAELDGSVASLTPQPGLTTHTGYPPGIPAPSR